MRSDDAKRTDPDLPEVGGACMSESVILHASVVAVHCSGVLILGASGSGKSGLCLRLMALGAQLVADDRVVLTRHGADLLAAAPAPLQGLVEARGVGLLRVTPVTRIPITLAVDLDQAPAARMPQPTRITLLEQSVDLILGRGVPNIDAVLMIVMQNRRVFDN